MLTEYEDGTVREPDYPTDKCGKCMYGGNFPCFLRHDESDEDCPDFEEAS